jgi:hypothetical protein
MNLADVLDCTGTLVGLGVVALGVKTLMKEHYIPWAKKIQEEYDIEEKTRNDDYRFSEDKK